MFIAMNRFKVRKGEESIFEARWRERDTHLRGFTQIERTKQRSRSVVQTRVQ